MDFQNIPYAGGTSHIVSLSGRPLVVVEVNGVNVPFYVSTGWGGKEGVPTGQWYPVMGIGEDGWFNKGGSEDAIRNYFYNNDLREAAEFLNKNLGDLRGDTRLPDITDFDDAYSVINRDMAPMSYDNFDRIQFQENLDRIAIGSSDYRAEPTFLIKSEEHRIAREIFARTDKNVRALELDAEGNVHLTVTDTFSRADLITQLGLDESPHALRRMAGNTPDTMEIVISPDLLPESMRPNFSSPIIHTDSNLRQVELIGNAPWFDATDRNGAPVKYIDVNELAPQEQLDIEKALQAKGVEYEIRPTSMQGIKHVIAVEGFETAKIGRMQDGRDLSHPDHAKINTPREQEAINKEFKYLRSLTPTPPANHTAPSANTPPAQTAGTTPDIGIGTKLLSKFGRVAGMGLKVLGPVGAIGVGAEILGLENTAHAATTEGHLSDEAFLEYQGILAAHSGQATLDPTLLGGEVAVQALYDEWAEKHEVSDELRETLQPGSLLELLASLGDGPNPWSSEEELAQLTPETIRSYQHALVSRDREFPRTITAGDREIEFSQALRHPEYFQFVYNQVQESNDWQLLRKLDQFKVLENAHEALAAAEPESAPEPNPEADSEITLAAMPETTPRPGG